jgi:hypothetical protein
MKRPFRYSVLTEISDNVYEEWGWVIMRGRTIDGWYYTRKAARCFANRRKVRRACRRVIVVRS